MSNYPYVSTRVITNTYVNDEFEYSICYNQADVDYDTWEEDQELDRMINQRLSEGAHLTETED